MKRAIPVGEDPPPSVTLTWAERCRDEPGRALMAFFCTQEKGSIMVGPVATGPECEAFRGWVDGLVRDGHETLLQLRQCGFTDDLAKLRAQLTRALQAGPAGPVCRAVGQRLLDLLARLPGAACFFLEERLRARER